MKALRTLQFEDDKLSRQFDAITEWARPVTNSAILDGVLVEQIALGAGTVTQVQHMLGRVPRGWAVVRRSADARVWDAPEGSPASDKLLALRANAAVTVSLWVF